MLQSSRRRLITGAAALAVMASLPRDEAEASLLLTGAGKAPGGAAITYTTLNPADTASQLTLSNGNLTVTGNASGFHSSRSIASIVRKTYFEVTYTTAVTDSVIGVGTAASPLNNFPGNSNDTLGIGYASVEGQVFYNNGTAVLTPGSWGSASNVAACAIDPTAKLVWFRGVTPSGTWNGTSADPAAGSGGFDYSAGSMGSADLYAMISGFAVGDAETVNFGATAFAGAVPSGYSGLY